MQENITTSLVFIMKMKKKKAVKKRIIRKKAKKTVKKRVLKKVVRKAIKKKILKKKIAKKAVKQLKKKPVKVEKEPEIKTLLKPELKVKLDYYQEPAHRFKHTGVFTLCPNCSNEIEVEKKEGGTYMECPHCRAMLEIVKKGKRFDVILVSNLKEEEDLGGLDMEDFGGD